MASVIIHGFKNDDEAKEFIKWYEGQGEQDIDYWMECRKDEGLDVRESINCNMEKTFYKDGLKQDSDGNWIMDVSE